MSKQRYLKSMAVMILFIASTTSLSMMDLHGFDGISYLNVPSKQGASVYEPQHPELLAPEVIRFMSTDWKEPLSAEENQRIEEESKYHLFSSSEIHQFPQNNVGIDLNETSRESVDAESDTGGVGTRSLDGRYWPWSYPSNPPFSFRIDFPALPLAPIMEGRWWPKKSYSTLAFDIEADDFDGELYIWAWISRDMDTYSRFLTFWFDNNYVDQFIIGAGGFKSGVHVPQDKINSGYSRHRVEISINYCGYVDHGWKLNYAWVGNGTGGLGTQQTPLLNPDDYPNDFTELTPRTGQTHCVMEYDVLAGESTTLNIETQNVADPYRRSIYVYFEKADGTYEWKAFISTGSGYQIYLGEHPDNCHRKLKLVFRYMPDIDYAKRITQLGVHHIGWNLEVDYMPYTPISTLLGQIDYMNAYYKMHAYHRVAYTASQDLPDDWSTTESEHIGYWNTYFNHKGESKWEYTIYVENLDPAAAGWYISYRFYGYRYLSYGIAISSAYHNYDHVIWHEYGHFIYISYDWPIEIYCPNPGCVMTDQGGHPSWYCFFHWNGRMTV